MTGWLLLLVGMTTAAAATAIAVAAAAASRLELVRWISQRLRGAAIASALLSTPKRILATSSAVASVGVVVTGFGFAAVLGVIPRVLIASAGLLLASPLVVGVIYAVPRAVGRRWSEAIVRSAAPSMVRISRVFAPVLPGVELAGRNELASALAGGQRTDLAEQDELTVFSGVVAFAERPVRDVMTPRADVVAVTEQASLREIGRLFAESGYSRLPVYRDSVDNIIGMFYAFDVINVAAGGRLPLRPIAVVPASKRCADLLYEMQRERRQFAVILDEFGGTAGIVTLEDLLEELVGEIFDEHDGSAPAESTVPGLLETDGATPASDIGARFGVALPGEAGTIGGLLARHLSRIPRAGERFALAGLEFDVLAATPTRVERLAIRRGPVMAVTLGGNPRQ